MTDLALGKLQSLLRTLFQFDSADLNFGIYRVLNYKRREISAFIETRLPIIVDEAFSRYAAADRGKLEEEVQQAKKQITDSTSALGMVAFDGNGQLIAQFRETPAAKDYLAAIERLQAAAVSDELKSRVYNDLFTFFNRYYEDGDFISKRRRGREETYAILYNGEEVLLHWANKDQYYIKTDERLAAYRFHVGEFHVAFEVRAAESTNNNNKSENRFYLLASSDPITWDADGKLLTVAFQHRGLSEGEALTFGTKGQQDKINAQSADTILAAAPDATLKGLLGRVPPGKDTSDLLRHLLQFTRRNTLDFFIHKDLRGFLMRELDHFIKTEALRLDELLATDANALPAQLQRARATRDVAVALIGLLTQVEDFQKRLFEKKKFVLRTDYCFTLDRVPEAFWPEVLASEAQMADWQALYGLDELLTKDGVLNTGLNADFLRRHPFLMLDTCHFPNAFKWRLLSELEDLDAGTDGVLFNSENFQALDLMVSKYEQQIKCIYIDPPYNTGGDGFLYKDKYQHSSWLSMITERLQIGRRLMAADASIFVSIGDQELHTLRTLSDEVFASNYAGIVSRITKRGGNAGKYFAPSVDYVVCYLKDSNAAAAFRLQASADSLATYRESDKVGSFKWRSWYDSSLDLQRSRFARYGIEAPDGTEIWPPVGKRWRNVESTFLNKKAKDEIRIAPGDNQFINADGEASSWAVHYKLRPDRLISGGEVSDNVFDDCLNSAGSATLSQLGLDFDFSKPTQLVERLILLSTSSDSAALSSGAVFVLDFFAGSGTTGHAVINLNREDGNTRRYILVEMGEYFPAVLLPRLKKAVYCSVWREGKPVGGDGVSQTIKYHTLEQYEDTLNNLDVESHTAEAGQAALKYGDEYLLQYMLDFETQGSPSLLNLDALADPFDYKLYIKQGDEIKPHFVDLVETFNYLLGLTVVRLRVFDDGGREYRAVLGEKDGKRVAVVWRKSSDLTASEAALDRDKAYITDTLLPSLLGQDITQDRLYVNSPCAVTGAEAIEPEFKRLMFGEAL